MDNPFGITREEVLDLAKVSWWRCQTRFRDAQKNQTNGEAMTTFQETITETFHVVSCYTCSLRFGITSQLYRRVVTEANGSVYCPACGNSTCWLESEDRKRIKQLEQKLKWEAENAERQKRLFREAQASLVSTKGVVTKLKRRVSAGVCPCCNRTFKQLSQHMADKHPDFVK